METVARLDEMKQQIQALEKRALEIRIEHPEELPLEERVKYAVTCLNLMKEMALLVARWQALKLLMLFEMETSPTRH